MIAHDLDFDAFIPMKILSKGKTWGANIFSTSTNSLGKYNEESNTVIIRVKTNRTLFSDN